MQIVTHPGHTPYAPENTLEAFRAALDAGADAVELDVRLSADDVPVVYHYAFLEEFRCVDGR
jgi:glycerophosphoryl diester phosphodiesterase